MAEREWRESRDLGNSAAGLILVLGCAAVLRFWALGHGLPRAVGVDEVQFMNRVVQMMKTGDFNPHFFDYPALYIYVQLLVACVRFIVGAMNGLWSSLEGVGAEDFYLWGRAISASMGAATVWLLYRIGTRWGTRHALLAAGLMAVMPLHVRESHYVLTETPLTFLATLTLLLSLRAQERATLGAFAWAGLAAGLAAATKYSGAAALLMPLVAAAMTPDIRPSRTSAGIMAAASALAAFLLAAPYAWLDLPAFLNAVASLGSSFRPRMPIEDPGWRTYLVHLRLALWWPGLVLMFVGLALAIDRTVRGPGRARWLLLGIFPSVFFYMISMRQEILGRYLLPVMPSVCLLIAVAVISGVSLLRRFETPRAVRTALIAALTVAAVVPPAISSVRFDWMISRPSSLSHDRRW